MSGMAFCGFASGFTGFAGWAGLIFELGVAGGSLTWRHLRGSNTDAVFTPGSRPGLLMCRPYGAHFWTGLAGLVFVLRCVSIYHFWVAIRYKR